MTPETQRLSSLTNREFDMDFISLKLNGDYRKRTLPEVQSHLRVLQSTRMLAVPERSIITLIFSVLKV